MLKRDDAGPDARDDVKLANALGIPPAKLLEGIP